MIESTTRHSVVRHFFAEHRHAWRDRYQRSDFDARNYRRRADVALALLGTIPNGKGRLLEVGCGAGVQAATAHHRGWKVSAIDLTCPLLDQARKEFTGPHWVAAHAEALPFANGVFDAVLMLGVVGYVNDPKDVLSKVHEVLVPGGHLIISWARDHTLLESVSHTISVLPDRLYLVAKRALRGSAAASHTAASNFYTSYNRFWDRDTFTALLADAGFTPRQLRGVNFGQLRLMDRPLWPERMDAVLSTVLEGVVRIPGFGWLGRFSRTHVALARRG